MKILLQMLSKIFACRPSPSVEEQYLAQAADAQDLQVRLATLERRRF